MKTPTSIARLLLILGCASLSSAERKFVNPVIQGDFPDPSICRVGDDYYLACSSFEYFPGAPILHSRDLVHWRLIGNALTRPSQLPLERARSSGGVYAPTLRRHNGVFYLVTTNVGGGGNFYVTATDPAGPWSEPIWLDREGIDPSLCFDDGVAYYTRHVGGGDGYIGQSILDLATGKLEGELREVWRGTGGPWAEGPHLYRRGDWWYLIISEGGTSYDHSITVARSRSPWGPFDPCPDNPVLTHKDSPELPLQAIGHSDLVETPQGWWAVCLGFRPADGRLHHLGRETMLLPVSWTEDGWPKFGDDGRVPLSGAAPSLTEHPWPQPPERDEFDNPNLAHEWNFLRNPKPEDWSLDAAPGSLRLRCSPVTLDDRDSPAYVCRRLTGMAVQASTRLTFEPRTATEEAGVAIRAVDGYHVEAVVTLRDGKRVALLRQSLGGKPKTIGEQVALADGPVEIHLETSPTKYRFTTSDSAGTVTTIGSISPQDFALERINAAEPIFHFTGARVGMLATANGEQSEAHADFDWFAYKVIEK